MTKQKQIEELNRDKEQLQDRIDRLELWIKRMKEIFWDDRDYNKTTEDLYKAIQNLDKRVIKEGAKISTSITHLYQENARLWYLIRAITGDRTLQGDPQEQEISNHEELDRLSRSPFIKPRF